jgi:hypothetical protein
LRNFSTEQKVDRSQDYRGSFDYQHPEGGVNALKRYDFDHDPETIREGLGDFMTDFRTTIRLYANRMKDTQRFDVCQDRIGTDFAYIDNALRELEKRNATWVLQRTSKKDLSELVS